MSILAKKRKHLDKRKNNNLLKTEGTPNIKMSVRGGPAFTFNLAGGRINPCPIVSYATGFQLITAGYAAFDCFDWERIERIQSAWLLAQFHSPPIIITQMEKIFSLFVFAETLPNPTLVKLLRVK